MKRTWLAIILAVVLTGTGMPAEGREPAEAQVITLLNYNVAGLPKLFGNAAADVEANQQAIGRILAAAEYDIVAVQEDFGYHKALAAGLGGYPYTTNHSGGVPGGDGMNLWSQFPLCNETRTAWETAYGIIEDGADEMTPKGILYTVVELAEGVYLDFYDIHADAYGDEGSAAARRAQYIQLAAFIEENSAGRPVIVTGDFNISLHHGDSCGLWENFMEPLGLQDAWIELYNDGNTADFSAWEGSAEKWDSIEKFLYRSGGGVMLEPLSFSYTYFCGEDGESLSDHPAAEASFSVVKTEAFQSYPGTLAVVGDRWLPRVWRIFTTVIGDLGRLLANLDELIEYLQ
ncbi:MAG: endonuclease/exonuclease/phosphatase family protein [Clostridia bacterium]|nr:endonuclease/exonuclease/phosphatase family protein [Clostridia bacterium]